MMLSLSTKEQEFIRYKFKDIRKHIIIKDLCLTAVEYHSFNKIIPDKLKCNSWFQVYKCAFEMGLLERDDYCALSVDELIECCADCVQHLDVLYNDKGDTDKVYFIYNKLLELYTSIEYSYLFRNTKSA